jgi:putative methyltransferase (TIGR04325 family)
MKAVIRETIARIPGLRGMVARWIFYGAGHNSHRFLGVFKSAAAAKARIPAHYDQSFDAPNMSDDFEMQTHERDLPLIRILSELLPKVETIFDLGGNIGLSFYQFRSRLTYPPSLRWTICDVPFVNEAGRRIAAKRGETQIFFTDHQQDGSGSDIYLTCGAIQYFEETLADLLTKLKHKPPRVLVNRVPFTEGESFFTLQHMSYSIVPYHIPNLAGFIASMEAIGYRCVEQWKTGRTCEILLRPDQLTPYYYGFNFELAV